MQPKRKLFFCALMAAGILYAVPAGAEDGNEQLPVIASWQDGHGYREDGTQISDGWAFDSVNPAGKYVLFGADGAVLQKAESREPEDLVEDYTGTELVPAVIALRAETFEGFHGTVKVYLQEKGGVQKSAELNEGNFFGMNLCVNSGDYTIQKVEAGDGEDTYVAKFSSLSVHLPEKGTRVMKICVMETKEDTPEVPSEKAKTEEAQTGQNMQQAENRQGKEEDMMRNMGIKKVMALFGGIGAACLAGILLLRRKQKKYD